MEKQKCKDCNDTGFIELLYSKSDCDCMVQGSNSMSRKVNKLSSLKFNKSITAWASSNASEKQDIYVKEIEPVLREITNMQSQNIRSSEESVSKCILFLKKQLSKFKPNCLANPFGYFHVVAKNFLIIKNKQENMEY
jgi:hypothetical protein